jgi:hypothetical protein
MYRVVNEGGDHLLAALARRAQEDGVTTGITLTVGGTVVTLLGEALLAGGEEQPRWYTRPTAEQSPQRATTDSR